MICYKLINDNELLFCNYNELDTNKDVNNISLFSVSEKNVKELPNLSKLMLNIYIANVMN